MDREVRVDPLTSAASAYNARVLAGAGRGPMPSPGDVIANKYRVDAIAGRGGMSVVYRATHLSLGQPVAIKVLAGAGLELPEYVTRLKREAHAASLLRSDHVVRVLDVGELGGRIPYLVMDYLVGSDFAAVLAKRGPLSFDAAIECILQASEALAEAHALGIVHRDLKPANLFVTEGVDGSPSIKVLDFGISRMTRRDGLSALTDPGTVLGTPSYMAPEQMEGARPVDARADIWALGAILYELLVGRPPYTGDSLPQIFMKIMRSRPQRPSVVRPDAPPEIDGVIARCLASDPNHRFQSVAELGWALSRIGPAGSREWAARIARVEQRFSAAMGGAESAASGEVPAFFAGERDGRDGGARIRRRALWRRVAAASAAALLAGAGTAAAASHWLHL